MTIQYDDIVIQSVTRLRAVIPQTPAKVAKVVVMENFQEQLKEFLNSAEISKILVTYSGSSAEGGRAIDDFTKTMGSNTAYVSHSIEAHICAKRYMYPDIADSDNTQNTMLRLMWTVVAALNGLKFYGRDNTGTLMMGNADYLSTEGMIFLESLIDRQFEGMIVAVCRFQVMEVIPELETLNAELPLGVYREITLEEYSQQNGTAPFTPAGLANDEAVVPDP